jgi:hypothetical protein
MKTLPKEDFFFFSKKATQGSKILQTGLNAGDGRFDKGRPL